MLNWFTEISQMKDEIEKYEQSKKNIENVIALSHVDDVDIRPKLSETYRIHH